MATQLVMTADVGVVYAARHGLGIAKRDECGRDCLSCVDSSWEKERQILCSGETGASLPTEPSVSLSVLAEQQQRDGTPLPLSLR
jgi:hypothetical protein